MADISMYDDLVVRQQVERIEVFTGLETKNRYTVMTPQEETVLYAYEESGFWSRQFLGTHRPLTINVMDIEGKTVHIASRRFFWFFSRLHVRDASGRALGSLRRRFSVFTRRLSLEDGNGQVIAEVKGPFFRPYTFMVYQQGMEVARLTKRWSGVLREAFTRADTFQVQFSGPSRDRDFASLVLAASFAIDLDFFERRKGRGSGGSSWSGSSSAHR